MYQIIGVKRALSLFALLCAVVIVAWAVLCPPADPSSIGQWWKIASGSVSVVTLFVGVVGQTKLFPQLCRLPLVRTWFPPIDGIWTTTLESNWPAIQQRSQPGSAPVRLAPVKATVTIIARLLYIRINLVSDNDRYSTSYTVFVRASRDPEDSSVVLHYIYKNATRFPKETDSSSHDGAAIVKVEGEGNNIWLEGLYWTNRNWHNGLNTAGTITFRRAKDLTGNS